MATREEIYSKVSTALVEALNVDASDITPSASLQGDLGAESIDFLDVVFRLEREFGIRIPRDELFPESIFEGDPECVQNGRVTAKGLDLLRQAMPFADLGQFEQNPDASHLGDLFTVDLITRYIQDKLGHTTGC
jgi:acyl carrier protein